MNIRNGNSKKVTGKNVWIVVIFESVVVLELVFSCLVWLTFLLECCWYFSGCRAQMYLSTAIHIKITALCWHNAPRSNACINENVIIIIIIILLILGVQKVLRKLYLKTIKYFDCMEKRKLSNQWKWKPKTWNIHCIITYIGQDFYEVNWW